MYKQYQFPACMLLLVLLNLPFLMSCSVGRKVTKPINVVSERQTLESDSAGMVSIDVSFLIPNKYMSTRSRLFITPQLVVDSVPRKNFMPLIVDAPIYAKKLHRRAILDKYQDPYGDQLQEVSDPLGAFQLDCHLRFAIPEDAQSVFIRAMVSNEGCGECFGQDTLYITGISNLVSLINLRDELKLNWIEPEFVIRPKIREVKGEAHLQFVINKHDINLALGNNSQEIMQMVDTLAAICVDSLANIQTIRIYGTASADGPYGFNTTLARNRALSAKRWLIEYLQPSQGIRRLIQTDSRPEGWWPVYHAMIADGHPDSLSVKQILTTYTEGNDDVQEYYIRRLDCWIDIKNNYLSKDRKVEYVYSYAIRSFTTDEELCAMYRVRPDAFNEDELLRVAALTVNDSAKMEVYNTLMKYFPQSAVAANNLAVLYLRKGDVEKARQILRTQSEYTPEMLTTLAVSYIYENNLERAVELLKEIDLPEARYNLGLIKARQQKLSEAYTLLMSYRDVNAAIVALNLSRNAEAERIMDELSEKSPLTEYVRAIIAARLGDEAAFRVHLENACKDEHFRKRAVYEIDFVNFQQGMVGQHNK